MLYFGDMVSITPFLEVLRREAKGSKIILVMDARFLESAKYNPDIDGLIPFDRHGKEKGLAATWKVGKKIGALHPDILLTLHGTTRSTMLALAMHPKHWGGEAGTRIDWLFMDWPMTIETYNSHAVDKYLKVLERLGVKELSHHGMRTYTSPEWEKKADEFLLLKELRKMTAWWAFPWEVLQRKRTGRQKITEKWQTILLKKG